MTHTLTDTQHIVFGAGLIGCYLGGVLTSLDFCTRLVCRPRIKDKLKSGMELTDYEQHRAHVKVLDVIDSEILLSDAESLPKADFLWLTVKCTGVEQALKDMTPWISKQTIILCCQNGLGSDTLVKQAYPENLVLRVMVPFNVVELSSGHYHRGTEGDMTIEHTDATCERISAFLANVQSALLPITTTKNMHALLWAKLQLNLGNSVNALADIPVKNMLEQRDYRKVIALLMTELLQVVNALDIKLPKITALSAHMIPKVLRLPDFIFSRVANKMLEIDPNARSSMWWDVSQGKPTEIEHINGAILKYAKGLNIVCPANQKMSTLISQLSLNIHIPGEQKPPVEAKTLLAWVSKK